MKNLLCIIIFIFPMYVLSQPGSWKSSPLDYMWTNTGNPNLSFGSYWTSLAFSPVNGQPYVAFNDIQYGFAVCVMTYDGTSWQYVGNPGFSAGSADLLSGSIAISPSGQPYVAFNDDQFHPDGRLTVMKFNGSIWDTVGHSGFSSGDVWDLSLAFSLSGEPYVAYGDKGTSWNLTVKKFDGTSWVNVGSPGFSEGGATYPSLSFNPSSGQAYVGYRDFGNNRKATVMKYDGTNWVNIGSPGFSSSAVYYTSLSFSPDTEPFLAYSDSGYSLKTTVMKFNGASWVNVGNSGFSGGRADYQSLAFNLAGDPVVAFSDYSNSQKSTVMKFTGTDWVNVGNPGFSSTSASYTSLAFSQPGVPYVAYIENYGTGSVTVMKYDSVFVGIEEQNESGLSIYPNPSSESVTIDLKNLSGNIACIEIDDFKGSRVLEIQTIEKKVVLDVANYPSGLYLVKIKTESSIRIGKFCKD